MKFHLREITLGEMGRGASIEVPEHHDLHSVVTRHGDGHFYAVFVCPFEMEEVPHGGFEQKARELVTGPDMVMDRHVRTNDEQRDEALGCVADALRMLDEAQRALRRDAWQVAVEAMNDAVQELNGAREGAEILLRREALDDPRR